MFISFKKMFNMLSDIDSHDHQITELKQAVKQLQSDEDNKEQAGKSDVQTVVNMPRTSAGLTLITVQVFHGDELVNVIIKDKEVGTF